MLWKIAKKHRANYDWNNSSGKLENKPKNHHGEARETVSRNAKSDSHQNEFQRPQTDLETARTRFDRLRMPKYINHARGNKFGDMKQKLKKCIVYGTAVKNQPKQHESEIEKNAARLLILKNSLPKSGRTCQIWRAKKEESVVFL